MGTELTAKPLDVLERGDLRKAEAIVDKHLAGFLETGNALLSIQECKLYRETHKTFAAYYKERFGFEKTHTYRLIDAADIVSKMSPIGELLPKNEAQARELVGMEPEAAKDVIEEVAEEGPVTAAALKAKRELFEADNEPYVEPEEPKEEPEKEEAAEPTAEESMATANKALESLARQVTALGKDPEDCGPLLLETSRLETFQGQLRTAAGTLRASKGHEVCPKCDGDGCDQCDQLGMLTKTQSESRPRKD